MKVVQRLIPGMIKLFNYNAFRLCKQIKVHIGSNLKESGENKIQKKFLDNMGQYDFK
jgi:hypothetical protein